MSKLIIDVTKPTIYCGGGPTVQSGITVLQGIIDPRTLPALLVGDYQREALSQRTNRSICEALTSGGLLTDLELAMRGKRYKEIARHTYQMLDPVYIVDGLQRVSMAIAELAANPDLVVELGARIALGTDEVWEREKFAAWNGGRTGIAPAVTLRNQHHSSPAVAALFALSEQPGWCLSQRVCWDQRLHKPKLMTARTYLLPAAGLHRHLVGDAATEVRQFVPNLDLLAQVIGVDRLTANVKFFYELVDESWGLAALPGARHGVQTTARFLIAVSRLLANHQDFWAGNQLHIDKRVRRKLASFRTSDPNVQNLSASGSCTSAALLYQLLVHHVNSGSRTVPLKPWKAPSRNG